VRGVFTEVNEGNQLRRAAIRFGAARPISRWSSPATISPAARRGRSRAEREADRRENRDRRRGPSLSR